MSLRSREFVMMLALQANGAIPLERSGIRQVLSSTDSSVEVYERAHDRRRMHAVLARTRQRNHQCGYRTNYHTPTVPRRKQKGYWEARALREFKRRGGNS